MTKETREKIRQTKLRKNFKELERYAAAHGQTEKFNELFKYIDGDSSRVRTTEGQLRAFESTYNRVKQERTDTNIMRQMKYEIEYKTDYKTAKAAKDAIGDPDIKLRDLKKMSTTDIVDKYYDEAKDQFKNSKSEADIGRFLAMNWFDSE